MNRKRHRHLASLRIASPCSERWDEMPGDARVRHCRKCEKQVHDLSALTADEAEALLARPGDLCVRYATRGDGTRVHVEAPRSTRRTSPRLTLAAAVLVSAACSEVPVDTESAQLAEVGVEPIAAPAGLDDVAPPPQAKLTAEQEEVLRYTMGGPRPERHFELLSFIEKSIARDKRRIVACCAAAVARARGEVGRVRVALAWGQRAVASVHIRGEADAALQRCLTAVAKRWRKPVAMAPQDGELEFPVACSPPPRIILPEQTLEASE